MTKFRLTEYDPLVAESCNGERVDVLVVCHDVAVGVGHKRGAMHFDDLHFASGYHSNQAYSQSKLANLMFSYRRF